MTREGLFAAATAREKQGMSYAVSNNFLADSGSGNLATKLAVRINNDALVLSLGRTREREQKHRSEDEIAHKLRLRNRFGFIRVSFVADFLEPRRSFALVVALRHGEVNEYAVGCGAVPMAGVRGNQRGIARMKFLNLFAFELDAANARDAVEGLADGMSMPRGSRARAE